MLTENTQDVFALANLLNESFVALFEGTLFAIPYKLRCFPLLVYNGPELLHIPMGE